MHHNIKVKNKIKNLGCFFVLFIVLGLPLFWLANNKWQEYQQINLGNKLKTNITNYYEKTGHLPKERDWDTLENLEFKMNPISTTPDYKRLNEQNYQLIYPTGFDGPNLIYDSTTNKWTKN